jgi:predicted Zn-dependent protease
VRPRPRALRRAYVEKAQALASARPHKTADDWELAARLETELGHTEPALLAYRRALGPSPRRTEWRIAFAQLLRQTGALKEARRELETVLAQEPANRPAQDLLEIVKREITLAGQ